VTLQATRVRGVVLFVSYSGLFGGAERLLTDYAANLREDCCLACPAGPLADAAAQAGVPVLVRPERELRLRGRRGLRPGACVDLAAHGAEIVMLARSLDADVVVAWGMRSAIAAALGRRRFVFAHNDLLPGHVVGAVVRAAARRARAVVTLSHAIARDLDVSGDGVDVEVVHPGIDVDSFGAEDIVRPPTVLVLGALVAWKRPDVALEAIAIARRRLPDLRLELAGASLLGDEEDRLLDRLRARAAAPDLAGAVALSGEVDARDALARAACLLHCAPREPFGLVVLEALAAGRPAVVPAAAGPAEIVDRNCGRLYAPGDAHAAADALVEIISDPALAARMGRHGRDRARMSFSAGQAHARFAAVVSRAGAEARRSRRPRDDARTLTLVTVTRNSSSDLARLLASVDHRLPGIRVVVVDNASADDTAAIARRHPAAELYALASNTGFAYACNRGVAAVSTATVALVNPDVELVDDSLLALAHEALRADRPARLLAPRVLNRDGSLQDTVHALPGSAADLAFALVPPAALPGRLGQALAPWRSRQPRRVGWSVGCAVVGRTSTLRTLGPFDERLFLYGEDLALGLRARSAGIETWLWPHARVIHDRATASDREFGSEPFDLLARARHQAVALHLGQRAAMRDDAVQALTFASRAALRRAVRRSASRERRQLEAVRGLRGHREAPD
jgi:N-acetylglucosaminyl-diphospho-decaprenol L-rhamnosyltransferase